MFWLKMTISRLLKKPVVLVSCTMYGDCALRFLRFNVKGRAFVVHYGNVIFIDNPPRGYRVEFM